MNSAPDNCCDFAGSYDLSCLPEIKKLEQLVLGGDYGGTSWTTRRQVEDIVGQLGLGANNCLLDIGAGAGWPGLLLGELSGCAVTLLDLPLNALAQAVTRAADDGLAGRVTIVSASATALPFAAAQFDRISHSDVLCCLPEKFEVLTEARRVARDSALMHFSVILPATGLSGSDLGRVLDTGPPFVGVEGDYGSLLRDSGWQVLDCTDVSEDYLGSLQRLVEGMDEHYGELVPLFGAEDLAARRRHREDQAALVAGGMMRREAWLVRAATQ